MNTTHKGWLLKNDEPGSRSGRWVRLASVLMWCVLGLVATGGAQTADDNSQNKDKNWTSTSESQDSTVGSRTRTVESHSEEGNRTIDRQSVGIQRSGSFEPYQDVEKESVKVNDTTTRTTVRTFGRDGDGRKVLVQTTEEEKQSLPDGGAKVVRSTSNPDVNGHIQTVQREVQVTKKVSANVEETNTTVFLPGANGGLAPAMKVQERQEHTGEHTVQIQKSTMLPDGSGNWQTGEVKQSTVTEDGQNRTSEERVSRVGPDGRLAEVSRTVGKDSPDASGQGRSTVETFSQDVPGSSSDGKMHLVQRVTTVRRDSASGSHTSQQQVEQLNPGDPSAGLQVTIQSTDAQAPGSVGTRETQTIQVRGGNGGMNVVSVDMTKSDKTPSVQVEVAPAAKPK
jgi:hypothetical protein